MTAFTYILECCDGTYYTGWTNDLDRRLKAHNQGSAARYTRGRRPVTLVYAEEYASQRDAQTREWEIKQLTRMQKQELIAAYRAEIATS